jgi:hypothetical protein
MRGRLGGDGASGGYIDGDGGSGGSGGSDEEDCDWQSMRSKAKGTR